MVQLQTFPEEMKVLTSLKGVYKDTPDRMDARKHNQAIKRIHPNDLWLEIFNHDGLHLLGATLII